MSSTRRRPDRGRGANAANDDPLKRPADDLPRDAATRQAA